MSDEPRPYQWPTDGNLPLEPGIEEWSALTESVKAFLGQALTDLDSAPTLSADQTGTLPTETPHNNLEGFLQALFDSGFNAAHPGFMAYIPGGGLVTSALADWAIKTMNRYGTAYFAAPKLAQLEYQVVRLFADWVGYGDHAGGVLTTGGSLANFTAMVTARRAMLPENFLQGVMYCSDQTHHSVMKAANLAGFSARNIRVMPSDTAYRLQPDPLVEQIATDLRDGYMPFLVVASAGTTNTGSIDPLPELADICANQHLWFHVDAAYGGAFLLTERGRERLVGIDRADSVTLDPHKGLFMPYGTGGVVVKDRDRLIEAHELRGEYMPDLDRERAHLDPFSLSVELSREHRGLKVALPLMLHGEQAFTEALDEKLDLTARLRDALLAIPELEVLNDPELTTVVFRKVPDRDAEAENRAFLDRINEGKQVYLSPTTLKGQFVLRVSILSHRTHEQEVDTVLAEIKRALS